MASPLFVADRPTLLRSLRLTASDTAQGSAKDVEELIDDAIQRVRLLLRQELGATRITAVLAEPFVESPVTDLQYSRLAAHQAEILSCRIELFKVLPVLFMDVSGSQSRVWNQEAAFREKPLFEDTAKLLERWEAQLADMLAIVKNGPDASQNKNDLQGFLVHPQYTTDKVRWDRSVRAGYSLNGEQGLT